MKDRLHSMRILVGLTALLFVTGILNFFRIAYIGVLAVPLAFGLYNAIKLGSVSFRNNQFSISPSRDLLILVAVLAVVWLLCAVTATFPEAYNFHDDYQKYFIQPVKMLATGSFYGSPLSTVGKETLGGQAAAQAIFIGFNGIAAINTFDAVFCKLLAAFLLLEFGRENRLMLAGVLSALLLAVIHPQYVNISSVYSFVCYAIGVVILHQRMLSQAPGSLTLPYAIGFGAFYATLIALKTPYAFFPIFHFPFVVISLTRYYPAVPVTRWSAIATLLGLAVLLPWALETVFLAASADGADGMGLAVSANWQNLLRLLEYKTSFYGGAPIFYALSLAGAAVLVVSSVVREKRFSEPEHWSAFAAITAAALVLVYSVAFIGKELHTFDTTLRYSAPFLIGLVPVACLMLASNRVEGDGSLPANPLAHRALCIIVPLLLIVQWLPTQFTFIKQYTSCGSSLSFSNLACNQYYRDYNQYVLEGVAEDRVRTLQGLVPEGATLIAWINYAHLLDFERNEIIEVDTAGLRNPWAIVPDAEYMMLDTRGYATRRKEQLIALLSRETVYDREIWKATLDFIAYLEQNVLAVEVLSKEEDIVLYKIRLPEERRF